MRRALPSLLVAFSSVLFGLAAVAACGGDDDDGSKFDGGPDGKATNNPPGFFPPPTQAETGPPPACVSKQAEAVEGIRPVDIIVVIDNSDSMSEEIGQVETQINDNFATILGASGIDYRVIMLSDHGVHGPGEDGGLRPIQSICIRAPLSGTSCAPIPATPVETERFFHHNIFIGSNDAFCRVLQTFGGADQDGNHPQGWGALLRADALKVFAVITDDRVSTSCLGFNFDDSTGGTTAAGTFESALFGLSPKFGAAGRRNYVWHSIVGLAPFDASDRSKPHPPTSPVMNAQCTPSSVAAGTGYQELSRLTGGLRYPSCEPDFTAIFQAMAADVIDKSRLACEYALPVPDAGTIDPETAVVRYSSGGGASTDFIQVADLAACGPNRFFIDGERIKLCPDACITVQNDPASDIKILFGCVVPNELPK